MSSRDDDRSPDTESRAAELNFLAGGGEMERRIRAFDWATTPLGRPAAWPQSLKAALKIALNSRYPIWLGWGWPLITFYNDAYIPVLGKRDVWALGASAREIWTDIWEEIGPLADAVLLGGEASWNERRQIVMYRNGYAEETYFTFSFSPLPTDDGDGVGGLFCTCTEDTQRVLGERRLATLRHLATATADTRSEHEAAAVAGQVLAKSSGDVAFTLIYLLEADGCRARRAAMTPDGVRAPWAPATISLDAGDGAAWPLARARDAGPRVLRDVPAVRRLPGGAWPEPASTVVIAPLAQAGHASPRGFLVIGASPRLPFDEHYESFIALLAHGVSDALSNARAYEEERRRAEALAELDRAKTVFFSNVSHEFRTPLTLMLGPIEDMLEKSPTDLSPASKGQLAVVHRNGLRLLKLVATMLDFSRIEAGRMAATYEPVDLPAHTAELASNFRAACERAGLRLRIDCRPLGPEPAYVDRDMWEKIVLNLLSNAFKFTLEGEIEVRLEPARSGIARLVVRDTGVGIPAEELPHTFERFHRIHGVPGRTYEGTGIGLALVQELVRLHGGTVQVESVLGEGSTFTVSIPLGRAHLDPAHVQQPTPLSSTRLGASAFVEEALRWLPDGGAGIEEPAGPPLGADARDRPVAAAPGERPRVVWADDNADMRVYVARLLGERCAVEAVADGQAALAAARRLRPDLILTDVMMPRLDGFGLLREVRADPALRDVPVVMLSARAGEESRIEGMQEGADDYLVKPFTARELVARVDAHLRLARLRRETERVRRESEERVRHANADLARRIEELERLNAEIQASRREREALLAAAERARTDAETANRAKDEFLAMLGHELRNPLAAIRNAVATASLDGHRPGALALARRQVELLGRLVDDLLDVARITQGRINLRREPVALQAVVRRALETSQPFSESRGHTLHVELAPEEIPLDGDPARLEQVVVNLVSNACKYTPPDGEVRVSVERRHGEGLVRVRDTGVGIAASVLPRIFDLFAQGDHTLDRAQGGLGIGLTLAQRIVEMHGGRIEARSEGIDKGAEFVVSLPVLDRREAGDAVATASAPPARKAARVLMVEDNPDAAESLKMLLELLGHEVHVAYNGVDALDIARTERPDIMLVDIGLPGMDGYELARRVRREEPLRDVPLVALTGYGLEEDKSAAAASGFDHHLVKPVDPEHLERLIQSV